MGKKVLWNQGVRTRFLRDTIQMLVIAVERCSCVEVLYAGQFTREIISLGWSPGLHGNVEVMLHLTSRLTLFGFQ